jgi:hypothetical protein
MNVEGIVVDEEDNQRMRPIMLTTDPEIRQRLQAVIEGKFLPSGS